MPSTKPIVRPDNGKPFDRYPDGCAAYWGYHLDLPPDRLVEAACEIDRLAERREHRAERRG